MNFSRFLVTALFLLFSFNLNANTLNVSTTGSDINGDGSIANPYATIQKGVDEALPNDTVYVFDGIYDGGIIINEKALYLIGQSREESKINIIRSTPQISVTNTQDNTVRIENFRIKRGSSDRGGGIYSENSNVIVSNTDFSHNVSSGNGGAIFVINSIMKVYNSLFYLNNSDSLGGSIYSKESIVELEEVEIRNNSAIAGGAVGLDTLSNCVINNSEIFNNGANVGGGIAVFNGAKLSILNTDIYGNNANAVGGIIPQHSDPENFPLYGGGGGLYQQFSDSLIIKNSNFDNNTTPTGIGGGLAIYYSSDIAFENVNINGNTSGGGGGGMSLLRSDKIIYNKGIISNNISQSNSGGGIFMGTETYNDTIIINGTFNRLNFINNYAQVGGGGLFLWSAKANVYNSTFSQNEANDNDGTSNWSGGGLSSHFMAEPNIINSIFHDNYPNSLYHPTTTTNMTVEYSLLEEIHDGSGNLVDIDPLFKDPMNGDFTLQANSPCIDAGISDFDDDGIDDITDFLGSAPDLGSSEYMIEPPLGFNGFFVDSSVVLTWLHVTDPGLQYYKVEQATDSLFTENYVEVFTTENSHTTENLSLNSLNFFRLSAFVGYWTEYSPTLSLVLEELDVVSNDLNPAQFEVGQNYPNPFNPSTTINYSIPKDGLVEITIYNMKGQLINNLINNFESSGYKTVQWNATNNNGSSVSAGMYIYSVKFGTNIKNNKMVLLK